MPGQKREACLRADVPGIHVFPRARENVDGRVNPGHDGGEDCAMCPQSFRGDATASSYDVQLHIIESISPQALAAKWIPGPRASYASRNDGGVCLLGRKSPTAATCDLKTNWSICWQ
ncbi:hypothetical protein CWO90_46080 [Bradyrhizobium sp. Leo121]|nr:hypothetical protein CWO90_46080 [Bradyrhizobium sp. Leo121]